MTDVGKIQPFQPPKPKETTFARQEEIKDNRSRSEMIRN